MADLDDFFAKKDRKKKNKGKKGKGDKEKPASEPASEQLQQLQSVGDEAEDSEWVEKEEVPTEIPLDGLKVQSLTDKEEDEKREKAPTDESTCNYEKSSKSSSSPWQPVVTQPEATAVPEPSPPTTRAGTAYVPPIKRQAFAAAKRAPPDLNNPSAFPSLPSSTTTSNSSSSGHSNPNTYTELKLNNKFSALRTE